MVAFDPTYARWICRMLRCRKRLQWYHNGGHLVRGTVQGGQSIWKRKITSVYALCMIQIHLPFPSTEKGFPCGLHPAYSPCTTSVCCTTIDSTFVHKNKLVGFVCSYTSCECGSLLSTPFNRHARELKSLLVLHSPLINSTMYLFHAITTFH